MIKHRIKSLHLAYEKGVNIVTGTDAGTPMNPHEDLIEEFLILKKECMTSQEVLAAATSVAGKALGIESQVGTLEEGKIADLIIIDGNPFDDIGALRDISVIIRAGKVIVQ